MIRRNIGAVVLICDECKDEYVTTTDDVRDAVEEAKEDGWLVLKQVDDQPQRYQPNKFKHYCPRCSDAIVDD